MFNWIQANFASIAVFLLLLLTVAAVLFSMVRDKKKGRSSCASCGGCAGCSGCSACGNGRPRDRAVERRDTVF